MGVSVRALTGGRPRTADPPAPGMAAESAGRSSAWCCSLQCFVRIRAKESRRWRSQERGVGVAIPLPQPHSGEGGPYLAIFRRATRVSRASQRARIPVSTDLISPSSPRASGSPVALESSSAVTSVTGFSSQFPLVSSCVRPSRSLHQRMSGACHVAGRASDTRVGIAEDPVRHDYLNRSHSAHDLHVCVRRRRRSRHRHHASADQRANQRLTFASGVTRAVHT